MQIKKGKIRKQKKEIDLGTTMVDNSTPIPLSFPLLLWGLCVVCSTFMIAQCNMCYLFDAKFLAHHEPGEPFSLWRIFDEQIGFKDVLPSLIICILVIILCVYVRRRINASNVPFSNDAINLSVYIKGELDIICGLVLSNYLGHQTKSKENSLIAFAITGSFCLVSSFLALVQVPRHDGLFSILSTVFTSGISYICSI